MSKSLLLGCTFIFILSISLQISVGLSELHNEQNERIKSEIKCAHELRAKRILCADSCAVGIFVSNYVEISNV